MPNTMRLLTADELAAHTFPHTYKWDKGATYGKWLVLVAPDKGQHHDRYGCKQYDGEDRGGLWLAGGEVVDSDGEYSMPTAVAGLLNFMGYKVEDSFWIHSKAYEPL